MRSLLLVASVSLLVAAVGSLPGASATTVKVCTPSEWACAGVHIRASEICVFESNSPPIGPDNWGAGGYCAQWVNSE